jgi:hypothetical protein
MVRRIRAGVKRVIGMSSRKREDIITEPRSRGA